MLENVKAENQWPHEPSLLHPFGSPNPAQTDPEARIFDALIGVYQCKQKRVDFQSGKSTEALGRWVWYFDMNGYGIKDYYRFNTGQPISQRIYNPKTKQWHVWYFIGQGFYYSGEWVGGRQEDRLVFEKKNEKLGDKLVLSRLEFFNISETGYEWQSSSIDNKTREVFIDWSISCERSMY